MFQIIQKTVAALRKKKQVIHCNGKSSKHKKVNFSDFWPHFNKEKNYLAELLITRYTLEITDKPDFLIYSVFGNEHRKLNCVKIFFTGENVRPNFAECDYSFSFDYINNP